MSCPTPVLPDVTTPPCGDGVWYGERGRGATGAPGVLVEEHGDGRVGARRDAGCASSCCMKGVAASARRVRPEPRRRTAGGGAPLGVVTAARACYGRFGYGNFPSAWGRGRRRACESDTPAPMAWKFPEANLACAPVPCGAGPRLGDWVGEFRRPGQLVGDWRAVLCRVLPPGSPGRDIKYRAWSAACACLTRSA